MGAASAALGSEILAVRFCKVVAGDGRLSSQGQLLPKSLLKTRSFQAAAGYEGRTFPATSTVCNAKIHFVRRECDFQATSSSVLAKAKTHSTVALAAAAAPALDSNSKTKKESQAENATKDSAPSSRSAVIWTGEDSADTVAEESGVKFESLGLSESLLLRLEDLGYKEPTDVQAQAIPLLIKGKDAAIQSYTGSGKTLAFLLPILSLVGPISHSRWVEKHSARGVEAIIVSPSRELAMQIVRQLEALLGDEYKGMVQQLIGGANMWRQGERMKENKPIFVVGTPGRIAEFSRTGKLQTHGCRYLVLDEADQLLSLKFRPDMLRILEHVGCQRTRENIRSDQQSGPSTSGRGGRQKPAMRMERQTVLVSATMPRTVLQAAVKWGYNPVHVTPDGPKEIAVGAAAKAAALIGTSTTGVVIPAASFTGVAATGDGLAASLPPNLDHRYVVTAARHRVDTLRKCIYALDAQSVLVFMNYGRRLQDAVFKLQARGMEVGSLHGGQNKMQRANTLAAFRDGKLRVLMVSEVAARGIDVVDCDLVVNLELPSDGAHYAHRAGRTGRIGRHGNVISLLEHSETFVLKKFAKQLGISITEAEVSDGRMYEKRTTDLQQGHDMAA